MAISTSPIFKQIDVALAQYYQHLNVTHYNVGTDGLFLNYIRTEELDHPELPIEEELGDGCDPCHCTYTEIWINGSVEFPIPPYAQIPDNAIEAFIFYILQYCYKHAEPPTDNYIETVLVPKCNGTLNTALLLTGTTGNDDEPIAFDQNASAVNEDTPVAFAQHILMLDEQVKQWNHNIMIGEEQCTLIYTITVLVNFYTRGICGDNVIHDDIISCIQLYLFGKEGSMYYIASDDDLIIGDDDCIADIDNGERLTARSGYAINYYMNVSRNKRDFCKEMKAYFHASYGRTVKVYEELKIMFARSAMQQLTI